MSDPILIQRIKSHLMLSAPFYGGLMTSLNWEADPNTQTASVDGITCRYNMAYVESLPFQKGVGLFAHEIDHCAHADHTRIGDRDLDLFNQAADYRTNIGLIKEGFQLPDGFLLDHRFDGMSAERIYNILDRERQQNKQQGKQPQQPQSGSGKGQGQPQPGQGQGKPDPNAKPGQGKPQGDGKGQPGQGKPGAATGNFTAPSQNGQPMGDADQGLERMKWNNAATMADRVSKRMIGKSPGSMESIMREMQVGTVDWKDELRRFMQRCWADRYSWLSADYRFVHAGWHFPSRETKRIPCVVIAVDTSMSVSQRMLKKIASEINEIMGELTPDKVVVIFCDTYIRRITEYTPDDYPMTLSFPGRGGTKCRPVFDRIDRDQLEPVCLIYFSDMEIDDWGAEPSYPVLWGALKHAKAPWGDIVDLREI